MERETQISALVFRTTKELVERHVRATGVKKGHLVVTRKSGEAIPKLIKKGKPSVALRSPMRDGG